MDHTTAWHVYSPLPGLTRRRRFAPTSIISPDLLPPGLHQAYAAKWGLHATEIVLKGHCPLLLNPPSRPQSIFEAIQALGPTGWPLSSACWTRSPEIAQAILDGKALGVADGSYMEKISKKHGAAAWIVQECADSALYCQGQVDTSGNTNEVSSYRSELQGVHALLMAIMIICQVYNIKSGSITLACDNEVAVRMSNDGHLSAPPSVANADLVRAIRYIRSQLPIQVHMLDVDGHKDKHTPFVCLTPLEKLNCLADHDAKTRLLRTLSRLETTATTPPTTVPDTIFGEGIRIVVGLRKVTGNPKNTISEHMYRAVIAKELDKQGSLNHSAFPLVNWDAIGTALSGRSPSFRAWATKHVTGQCGVGSKMHEWKFWETSNCPCCNHPDEITTHLPFCPSDPMQEAYATQLANFSDWLSESDTVPPIALFLQQALSLKTFPSTGIDASVSHPHTNNPSLGGTICFSAALLPLGLIFKPHIFARLTHDDATTDGQLTSHIGSSNSATGSGWLGTITCTRKMNKGSSSRRGSPSGTQSWHASTAAPKLCSPQTTTS
jgi:hypothetical protein